MPQFSKRSLESLKGVHPKLAQALALAIRDTPVDFTITSGLRTAEQQQELYAQGRTAPGPIVTNADGRKKKSNHQAKADGTGHAVDLYPCFNGQPQVAAPIDLFEKIARHVQQKAREIGIEIQWGGDWKTFRDAPHLELKP